MKKQSGNHSDLSAGVDPGLVRDLNVAGQKTLPSPAELWQQIPLGEKALQTVQQGRETLCRILERKDHRMFAVVGPCSIHDADQAREYAKRLKALSEEVGDTLFLLMRTYFEKPRTTVGWKGLINDPRLDDSFHVGEGLVIARKLLLDLAEIGVPAATEALDPILPQYVQDLISWSAIGARTTESQTHREMASGLSSPVGFKNGTDGSLEVAINALQSVSRPHRFLGVNQEGKVTVICTKGNPHAHIVLRGGSKGPNYDSVHIQLCEQKLAAIEALPNIVVDCSHANSEKDYKLQPLVLQNVGAQILEGNRSIVGVMLESNLEAGQQSIPEELSQLRYGVSVTDACMDWATTEKSLRDMRKRLREVLPQRAERPQLAVAASR